MTGTHRSTCVCGHNQLHHIQHPDGTTRACLLTVCKCAKYCPRVTLGHRRPTERPRSGPGVLRALPAARTPEAP